MGELIFGKAGQGPRKTLKRRLERSVFKRAQKWHRKVHFEKYMEWFDLRQHDVEERFSAATGRKACLDAASYAAIRDFYARRGVPVRDGFYRMMSVALGHPVDYHYVPDEVLFMYVLPAISPIEDARVFQDKSVYGFYYSDVLHPYEVFRVIRGQCYSHENEAIGHEEAIRRTLDYGTRFVVKPTIDSGEGKNVSLRSLVSPNDVERLFADYGDNFTVQEVVSQSESTKRLNPSSLNTIRITSLFLNGRYSLLSSMIRAGSAGAVVDNVGAGGFCVGINPDGTLAEHGFDHDGRSVVALADGTPVKGLGIEGYDRVCSFAERLHRRMPYVPLIGWDIAIDATGEPVLIELNASQAGISFEQMCSGPIFGDRFDEVMDRDFSAQPDRELVRTAGSFRPDAVFPVAAWRF